MEKEAAVVRLIYKLFLDSKTSSGIAKHLTKNNIPTPSGKANWQSSTVESILANEKYKGDAILQKTFTVDFLNKKKKINEGEVPQYYVENSHTAIVSPEVYDLVQNEIKKRKGIGRHQSGVSCFSGKIICGECGGFYGSKVWHSTSKYRKTIWQCNNKFRNGTHCRTPHLHEATIQRAFLDAFNSLIVNKQEMIRGYEAIIWALTDTTALEAESDMLQGECDVAMELMRKCVEENAHTALDQEDYQCRYRALLERYMAVKSRLDDVAGKRQERVAKREGIVRFLQALERSDGLLTEFDEELWQAMVELVTVHSDHDITFLFKDGTEVSGTI